MRVIQATSGVDVAYGEVEADADVSNGDLTAPLTVTGVNGAVRSPFETSA
ncbi:hypothetical protein HRED_10357, partial [Candidatus Haloredivivus sp. G17]